MQKCLTFKDLIRNFVETNIVKIMIAITLAMIFVIANSNVLIIAAIYGSWLMTFLCLFSFGLILSYLLVDLVFKILEK